MLRSRSWKFSKVAVGNIGKSESDILLPTLKPRYGVGAQGKTYYLPDMESGDISDVPESLLSSQRRVRVTSPVSQSHLKSFSSRVRVS